MSVVPGPLGKYELLERLGIGGMAEVWKAFDTRLQRTVAIKFLHTNLLSDPALLERFKREAQAVASLHHPNIVQIYDFEVPDPAQGNAFAYMVMDYIEGPTLAQYLQNTSHIQRFLEPLELVSLFFSISEAIDYAHQRGLLHRDIKPGNILLDRRSTERNAMGEPVLTDFGIVKILGSATGTLTSSSAGTPLYISPEQAQGHPDSAASDIYSLGIILYETCTGVLPFKSDNIFSLMQQHISKIPESPEKINPSLSPSLAQVILRSLAKKPEERFDSASDLVIAMAEALNVPLPAKRRGPLSLPGFVPLEDSALNTLSPEGKDIDTSALTVIGGKAEEDLPTIRLENGAAKGQAETRAGSASANPETVAAVAETKGNRLSEAATHTPVPAPATPIPQTFSPPLTKKPRSRLLIVLTICLVLLLAASGLTTFLVLRSRTSPTATSQVVGTAFFSSSGKGDGNKNLGINDTFQVGLSHISPPAAGKKYYAWLLPDLSQSEANPRAVGILILQNSSASLATPYIDPQQQNLIRQFSRFLVTEEPANPAPSSPSLDTHLWRYYALLPQDQAVTNCQGTQLSVLCHVRHLLAQDPDLMKVNLSGGLNYWFFHNLTQMQTWSQEALASADGDVIRHKAVNMLTVLDGMACISRDLQQGAPGESNVPDAPDLSTIAAISLLGCSLTPDVPGYLTHIHNHMNAILQSPGVTQNEKALGIQIGTELNQLNEWLTEVRADAQRLVAMKDADLKTSGKSLVSQMNTLMTNVVSGGIDAQTNQFQKGAVSITAQIQQMATMDVMVYTPKTS